MTREMHSIFRGRCLHLAFRTTEHVSKNMKNKLNNNTLIVRFGAVAVALLLFFNWSVVVFTQLYHFGALDWAALQPSEWPIWLFLVLLLGSVAIIFVVLRQFWHAQQLARLTTDLQGKLTNNADNIYLDWTAKGDAPTQQLIEVTNQIGQQTAKIRAEERASEQSKDEMITNISHDLRTPLTAIIGYLGLVEMAGDTLDATTQAKYVHTAYEKANQMKMLVEDLFEYSQTQARDAQLNINTISLGDLFAQLAASYELEAHDKKLALTQLTKPELLIMEADSDKLARALMNLVTNALKYGHGATFIKLTGQIRGDEVEIRVINDGEAIPKTALGELFDRFYRVESSRNTETGGTGLGLAIVKGIVDQHGGRIHAESNADITSFVMTLPLKQASKAV